MAVYEIDVSGRIWRLHQRQVGWLGQTGRMYTMDEKPSETEPGSFTPMYITTEADPIQAPEPEELISG